MIRLLEAEIIIQTVCNRALVKEVIFTTLIRDVFHLLIHIIERWIESNI